MRTKTYFSAMLGFRPFSSSEHTGYRFGFQGQEKDDELKGNGNSVNYKYRMHDPRVGRFFAVDPLTKKYPHYSPYSFSGNKLIHRVELEGLEDVSYQDKRADGVTYQVDIDKQRNPNGNLTNTVEIENNGTQQGTANGMTNRIQSVLNQYSGIDQAHQDAVTTATTGNPAQGGSVSLAATIRNQFNQDYGVRVMAGGATVAADPTNIDVSVQNAIDNGNGIAGTAPGNVTRVLILVNGTAASVANAISEADQIRNANPNVLVGVATAPNLINEASGLAGPVRIVLNPAADGSTRSGNSIPSNIVQWNQGYTRADGTASGPLRTEPY